MPGTLVQPLRLPDELAGDKRDFLYDFPFFGTLARCRRVLARQLADRQSLNLNAADYWPNPQHREIVNHLAKTFYDYTDLTLVLLPDDELRAFGCLDECDDLELVNFIMAIEKHYHCELPDDVVFSTIHKLVEFLRLNTNTAIAPSNFL